MSAIEEVCKKAAERIKSEQGTIELVSHYDADGLSAAAIMVKCLKFLEKSFNVTITKYITEEVIEKIVSDSHKEDFGIVKM